MNKLNILHIANIRFFNATAWYAIHLCRMMNKLGHNSKVVLLQDTVAHENAIKLGVPIIAIPYEQKDIFALPQIYTFLKETITEEKPDIVNCHRGELYPLFAYFRKKFSYKLVRTRGDQRPAKNSFINRLLYQKYTDAHIVTNSSIQKQLIEDLKVPEKKVNLIWGGVDTSVFYNNPAKYIPMRKEYKYDEDDVVIGILGRLDPVKGHKEAFKALALALPYAKNLKLCVMGFDCVNTSEELYRLAHSLGIRDKVKITGKVDNIEDMLNMCDVALVPSIDSEAIARAAFEFIACGIPLISSDVGVLPDFVSKNALFPAGNADKMAHILIKIHKAFVNKFSEEYIWLHDIKINQAKILPEITLDSFVQKTIDVYTKNNK